MPASELALLSRPVLLRRLALAAIAALAALSYAWALGHGSLEYYYGAAVRSMSMSWHNFIFGAFDPAGTITLDKLPGAFWFQALSVRAFGMHPWAIVLPQVIEGVLTVLVLYRAVSRLAGPAAGLWGLASRRRQPRSDPLRACFVLWGAWLVTLFAVFSVITTINAYYTAALSPPVAAIIGAGAAASWSAERTPVTWSVGLGLVVAGTAGYAAWLVYSSGGRAPGWLVPALIVVAVAATGVSVWSLLAPRAGVWAGALAAGLVSVALVPAVASASLAAHGEGAFDTPFESARTAEAVELSGQVVANANIAVLQNLRQGAPYVMAAQTAVLPSVIIYDSGLEALPIGGLTGTIPSPTLSQLEADIRAGRFHLVWIATADDPRLKWIATHCIRTSKRYYWCGPGGPRPVGTSTSTPVATPVGAS